MEDDISLSWQYLAYVCWIYEGINSDTPDSFLLSLEETPKPACQFYPTIHKGAIKGA